jgi:hypothetical protein
MTGGVSGRIGRGETGGVSGRIGRGEGWAVGRGGVSLT